MPKLQASGAFAQALDDNARALNGAYWKVYAAGTTTQATTYSNALLTIANAWPVIGDAAGRLPDIYVAPGNYRIRVETAGGVLIAESDNNVVYGLDPGEVAAAKFKTLANLRDDETMGYSLGGSVSVMVAAGDIIEAGGLRHSVLASSATDADVTTTGVVKLRVLADARGVAALAYANPGDADDTDALHRAIANTVSGDIYLPDGTLTATHLLIDKNVRIMGNGRERTRLNVTGFTTYNGTKAAIAAVGSTNLRSQMALNGLEIDVQTAEADTVGMLVTRKLNMDEVFIHDAPLDGIRLLTINPNTEAPYFCQWRNVWSKENGRNGLHITENCNANRFEVCQFDTNGHHGVHQQATGAAGIPQAVYNAIFDGGQASYNQRHGYFFENGSECFIYGAYAEFNSQVDGGNPKTGAYNNLQLGSTFARGFFNMGSLGTSTDIEQTIGLNNGASNTVYTAGLLITPFDKIEIGYSNVGAGRTIRMQGGGGAQHNIEFYEGTSIIARLRYNGTPSAPLNEIRMEVTADNGANWDTLWHGTNNGNLGFYGTAPVAQGTTAADATDLASAIALANNLRAIIRNVGLAT